MGSEPDDRTTQPTGHEIDPSVPLARVHAWMRWRAGALIPSEALGGHVWTPWLLVWVACLLSAIAFTISATALVVIVAPVLLLAGILVPGLRGWVRRMARSVGVTWGIPGRPKARHFAVAAAGLLLAVWVVNPAITAAAPSTGAVTDTGLAEASAGVTGAGGIAAQIVMGVLVVLIGPAAEELVYRGLVLRLVGVAAPQEAVMVVVSAVVFGASHWHYGWVEQVTTGVLGLLYGLLAVRTGSLVVPFAAHAALNLLWVATVTASA